MKSALPAATEAGEMDDNVGGRTPLNPPQPHTNREKTAKSKKRRNGRRLIACIYGGSLSVVGRELCLWTTVPERHSLSFELLFGLER
jgi:hypothetical protein